MLYSKKLVSTLWVFLTVNYIFCDVFSLYYSKFLHQLLTGKVDGIVFTESFLLLFSVLLEIPMLMIVLSIILKKKLYKIINIIAAIVMLIIQIGSLVTGKNSLHYLFFSTIEIGTLLLIIYMVCKKKINIKKAKFTVGVN